MRAIVATLAGAGVLTGTLALAGPADAGAPTHDAYRYRVTTARHTMPECEQEDSARCVWNAGSAGNGLGTSFIALTHRPTGVIYLSVRHGRLSASSPRHRVRVVQLAHFGRTIDATVTSQGHTFGVIATPSR